MVSAATYLLISSLFFFTSNNQDVFTSSNSEFLFSGFFILGGLITYFIIISKATLESKNDFYFLGFVRAIFASGLIIFPIFSFDSEWYYSLLVFLWSFFYLGAYMIRLGKKRVRLMFKLPKSVEKRTLLEFIKEVWPFGLFLVCWSFFLFFDRMLFKFYIDKQTLADHVTMQDLFNRVAIISGNISLVYYPTLSKVTSVPKQFLSYYYKQVAIVLFFFFVILITSFFILDEALQLWLKREYSSYIGDNAIIYLIGIITFNFSIIQIRAMHAQKKEKVTVKYLCFFLILFITFVGILAFIKEPSYVPIGQGIVFLALIVVFHNQLVKK
jgi:O-antigen/teichoic acid export membrane protein